MGGWVKSLIENSINFNSSCNDISFLLTIYFLKFYALYFQSKTKIDKLSEPPCNKCRLSMNYWLNIKRRRKWCFILINWFYYLNRKLLFNVFIHLYFLNLPIVYLYPNGCYHSIVCGYKKGTTAINNWLQPNISCLAVSY